MTQNGITIRINVDKISVISRNTQGVRLVKLDDGDKVAVIASVVKEEDSDEEQTSEEKK